MTPGLQCALHRQSGWFSRRNSVRSRRADLEPAFDSIVVSQGSRSVTGRAIHSRS
jgi:hypothetical protein